MNYRCILELARYRSPRTVDLLKSAAEVLDNSSKLKGELRALGRGIGRGHGVVRLVRHRIPIALEVGVELVDLVPGDDLSRHHVLVLKLNPLNTSDQRRDHVLRPVLWEEAESTDVLRVLADELQATGVHRTDRQDEGVLLPLRLLDGLEHRIGDAVIDSADQDGRPLGNLAKGGRGTSLRCGRVSLGLELLHLQTRCDGGVGRNRTSARGAVASRNDTVIGWDLNPDPECEPHSVDVGDWESVRGVAERLPDHRLVGVANCAGASLRGPFMDTLMTDFDRLMRVNVTGAAHVAAATHSRLAHGGVYIAVGSVAGQVSMAERAAYCASKAAVAMLSRCLASEWARDGIQVVCLNPGFTDVGMAASSSASGDSSLSEVLARTPTGRLVPSARLLDVFELLVDGKMRGITGSEITVDELHIDLENLARATASHTLPVRVVALVSRELGRWLRSRHLTIRQTPDLEISTSK